MADTSDAAAGAAPQMTGATFCRICGTRFVASARFCRACGTARHGTTLANTDGSSGPVEIPGDDPVAGLGAGGPRFVEGPPSPLGAQTPAPPESGPLVDGPRTFLYPPPGPPAAVPFGALGPAHRSGAGRGWLIGGLVAGVFVLAGIAVAIVLVASSGGSRRPQLIAPVTAPAVSSPAVVANNPTVPSTPPAARGTLPPLRVPSAAPAGTGGQARDASGYNVGPGCSDNPGASLPGCGDSPSTPNGDSEGSCANGLTIDRVSTSCGLAENVYAGYRADGAITAYSPERAASYVFMCKTGGAGTTGYTICLGHAGNATLYLRWHR